MRDPMFEWPLEAKYDREIPRERIYEHGRVNADLRGRFDCEVARITWAYKLASVTIDLADAPGARGPGRRGAREGSGHSDSCPGGD